MNGKVKVTRKEAGYLRRRIRLCSVIRRPVNMPPRDPREAKFLINSEYIKDSSENFYDLLKYIKRENKKDRELGIEISEYLNHTDAHLENEIR